MVKKVLYLKSSPRGERSYSVRVAEALLQELRSRAPEISIDQLDLFEEKLPAFDGVALEAKYAILRGSSEGSSSEHWRKVEQVISRFKEPDLYVFSVPMWNFSLPYRLKHYLDLVVQPGYTFSFDPNSGYAGLLGDKKAIVICARGGEYPEGSAEACGDFQKSYLRHILSFMGIRDQHFITIQPTLASGPEAAKKALEWALAKAVELVQLICAEK